MKKRFLSCIIIFVVSTLGYGQNIKLSGEAEIGLITGGPGEILYTKFGHSAIRVKDIGNGVDVLFNYGSFDFEAPNFYLNFSKGKLLFKLAKYSFEKQKISYSKEGRSIFEQQLDLSMDEKQHLFDYLLENAKEENASYLYDPFFNNCATRPRDVLKEILGNELQFDDSYVSELKTIRQLYMDQLPINNWGSFGITVALGSVIDRRATPYEHMYMPEYLKKAIDKATLMTEKGPKPLVKESETVLAPAQRKPFLLSFIWGPLLVFSLISLFGAIITYRDIKKNKRTKSLDVLIFLLSGLAGLVLLILWFGTNHAATANNFNILWAFAPNLLFLFFVEKNNDGWNKRYIGFLLFSLTLMVLLWLLKVQLFSIVLIPVIVLMFLRYGYLYRYFSTNIKCRKV